MNGYDRSIGLRQHHTIASASLSRLFAPLLQFEKREIQTVFLRFPNFELEQKSCLRLLAELCGDAQFCVAAAERLLSILYFDRRCILNEAYLPAQQASPFQGSRFPPENGYVQWPQGSGPPSCEGPQGSVRLMRLSVGRNKRNMRLRAKRELQRGE